jgi:hypothetical protein
MKYIIFLIIWILTFPSLASEQCKMMNVSGVPFSSALSIVERDLGPFSEKSYFKDIENSGQNSGWRLFRSGLEVFVADIGGLTFAHVTDPELTVSSQYKINDNVPESTGKLHIEIHPCSIASITEQRIVLNLRSNGTIQSITIEDYGL